MNDGDASGSPNAEEARHPDHRALWGLAAAVVVAGLVIGLVVLTRGESNTTPTASVDVGGSGSPATAQSRGGGGNSSRCSLTQLVGRWKVTALPRDNIFQSLGDILVFRADCTFALSGEALNGAGTWSSAGNRVDLLSPTGANSYTVTFVPGRANLTDVGGKTLGISPA